ncbi:response regulator transcription factor [Emticicia sp. BO119]|uniref:response regulator transcription factor n=1 Tax=Emticicia sp. BO119 TaxID=2757768 RepID=UPI0015F1145F|nr:response regulator transcription factor [Emticicia sp. BO119]MBA4849057.1 response regulator transcription factor [Emticicia sp. BO119]
MANKIKLMIVDDHAVVRKGIINLLEDEENIEIVGEAPDGIEALEGIKELKPTIILLDLSMPKMTGFEVAKIISQKYSAVRSIIFSMHNNQEYMVQAVENGAMGYLLKDTSKEEILKALDTVSNGNKYFPPTVSAMIIDGLLNQKKNSSSATKKEASAIVNALSKQEKVILNYIVEGLNSQEISEKLKLSVRTVSNHRANILRKTQVKNTAELVRLAVE